jgi:hypothetical protein
MKRARETIVWWEKRRIAFNLAVLAAGFVSGLVIELVGSRFVKPGDDVVEPLAIIFGVIVYAVAANACYTLGWITEILWNGGDPTRTEAVRPKVFRLGMIFSVVLTLLPGVLVPIAWAVWGFR